MKLRIYWYGQVLCIENVRNKYEKQPSIVNTKDWVDRDIMHENN
jgi:hypothetical protein